MLRDLLVVLVQLASQSETVRPASSRTRTGRLFTQGPTRVSMPGSSAGRPENAAPKTTSSRSLRWLSRRAQAPWTRMLSVTRSERASALRAAVVAASSRVDASTGAVLGVPAGGCLVRQRCGRREAGEVAPSRTRANRARRSRASRCRRRTGTVRASRSACPREPRLVGRCRRRGRRAARTSRRRRGGACSRRAGARRRPDGRASRESGAPHRRRSRAPDPSGGATRSVPSCVVPRRGRSSPPRPMEPPPAARRPGAARPRRRSRRRFAESRGARWPTPRPRAERTASTGPSRRKTHCSNPSRAPPASIERNSRCIGESG